MPRAILIILACLVSFTEIQPAIGAYNYTIFGILSGLIGLVVVSHYARRDHATADIIAGAALISGVLIGVFWPAAIGVFLYGFTFSRRGVVAERGVRDASRP